MKNSLCKLAVAAFLVVIPAHTTLAQEEIKFDGFCSYDDQQIEATIYGFDSDKEAEDATKKILSYAGLSQNFVIKAANVPNAVAAIQGERRLILYNQLFMREVARMTSTDWAKLSILAHEIGHHLQGHTIQSGGSRPPTELEADKYSGFILYSMGATLAQATAAMNALGSATGSATHPAKSARLAAITNGWQAADDLKKLNGSPGPAPTPSTTPATQSPVSIPTTPGPAPTTPAVNYISRVVFPGDPMAYYVTTMNDIVAVHPNGSTVLMGKKVPPTLPGFAWMYQTAFITYGVAPDGRVFTAGPMGTFAQIGYVTNP